MRTLTAAAASGITHRRNRSKSILPPLRIRPTRLPRSFGLLLQGRRERARRRRLRRDYAYRSSRRGSPRAISSSVTCTMREAPLRMIASASGIGNRASPCRRRSVLLVSVRHDRAGRERQRVGRRFGRLHADDFGLQPEQIARQDAAADAGALPDRHIEHVEVGRGCATVRARRSQRRAPDRDGTTARYSSPSSWRGARLPRARPENPRRARPGWRRTPASRGSSRPNCRAAHRSSPARRSGSPRRRDSGRDCRVVAEISPAVSGRSRFRRST